MDSLFYQKKKWIQADGQSFGNRGEIKDREKKLCCVADS